MDIHHSEHKVKYAIKKIKSEPGLSEEDRNVILEYILKLQSQGLNAGRVAKYAYSLIVLKRHLKCNFKDAGSRNRGAHALVEFKRAHGVV
ncbi:MAG: hypothetical protein RXR51_05475 [Nitrososphaeria archaeon]